MPARAWSLAPSPSAAAPDNASRTTASQRANALPSTGHTELLQSRIKTRRVSWLKVYRVDILIVPSHMPHQQETTFRRKSSFPSSVGSMQARLAHPAFSSFVSRLSGLFSPHTWVASVPVNPVVDLPSEVHHRLAPQSIRCFVAAASDRVHSLPNCSFPPSRRSFLSLTLKLLSRFQPGQL